MGGEGSGERPQTPARTGREAAEPGQRNADADDEDHQGLHDDGPADGADADDISAANEPTDEPDQPTPLPVPEPVRNATLSPGPHSPARTGKENIYQFGQRCRWSCPTTHLP